MLGDRDTGSEPLPIDDTVSGERQTDARASVSTQTDTYASVKPSAAPALRARWTLRFLDDIRPTLGSNVTRIYGISDCVIAVAFTLFVVNIHQPPAGLSEAQLQNYLKQETLPDILFYLGTYLVVASSWISHYRILTYLKVSSSSFIILNVVFLASIVFLPVPVLFFYLYRNQAEIWRVFALTQVVTSIALLLMWVVARADHLLDPEIPPEYLRYTTVRLIVIPLGTLLSIGISFSNVWVAEGIFLFFYIMGWFMRGLFYRHHLEGRYLTGTIRMCSITDNMTAVAITFLIASITGTLLSNAQQSFSTALDAVLAELPVYSLTFLIVGFFWLSHHRIFMVIRRHDMTLIWLNFAFLVFIELQPLFNGLQASYRTSQTTSILYACEQVATGLMLLVIWWYAARGHRLIDRTMDKFDIMTFALRAL
ncbi:MAG TPA: TMEM175 family protein, partial [Ktedonobacteraceae bacterium]